MPQRRVQGLGERAFGAARFGLRTGENAARFGAGAFRTGKRVYSAGRKVMAWHEAEEQARRGRTHSDLAEEESIRPLSAEEQKMMIRERNLEKVLRERLHPEVAEELVEFIQEAMQSELSGVEMHAMLKGFFKERYRANNPATIRNINAWIRTVLRVTHPAYAKSLRVE